MAASKKPPSSQSPKKSSQTKKAPAQKSAHGSAAKTAMKKLLVIIIVGFVAVAFIGSFAYRYATRQGSAPSIAVVNGEPISAGPDSMLANFYRQFYEQERQAAESEEEELTEQKNRELMRRALDTIIQRTIILQYAEREGITVNRETVLSAIIKKGYYAGNGKTFDEQRYNSTPESTRQDIFRSEKEQLIINMFVNEHFGNVTVSEVELKSFFQFADYGKKIEYVFLRYDDIPEETLRAFYEENPQLFEKAHVAHILIKDDEEKAQEILEKVKANPERFAQIAQESSEDTTKDKGGDLGWFYRKDMIAEFSESAFTLKKGEISPLVRTTFGTHIIKALDDVKVESYDSALSRIKSEYVSEHRDEVEKKVATLSKEILTEASADSKNFDALLKKNDLRTTTTDYISVMGQYILDENRNTPLFELMNNEELVDLVFATEIGRVGGPIKTPEGEILFKVIGEKSFDQSEYEKSKEYLTGTYNTLKENYLFNDWYNHEVKNSKIVDNFSQFFPRQG
jgi:parvulin-like peptidyl-prolyl isomerase